MIKRIGFVRRHPSLDVESFHARWRGAARRPRRREPGRRRHAAPLRAAPAHGARLRARRVPLRRRGRPVVRVVGRVLGDARRPAPRGGPRRRRRALRRRARGLHRPRDGGHRRARGPRRARHQADLRGAPPGRAWTSTSSTATGGRCTARSTATRPAVRKYFLRYEQNHRLPEDYDRPASSDLDGVTIEWFRSARDFFGMAVDPDSRDVIRDDEQNFLDPDGPALDAHRPRARRPRPPTLSEPIARARGRAPPSCGGCSRRRRAGAR